MLAYCFYRGTERPKNSILPEIDIELSKWLKAIPSDPSGNPSMKSADLPKVF